MKGVMYIPEIGDRFRLTHPWEFVLHNEYRNSDVWEALGCAKHPDVAPRAARYEAASAELREMWDKHSFLATRDALPSPFLPLGSRPRTFTRREIPEELMERDQELREILNQDNQSWWKASVTLPKGTVLSVDRIYIRKGASDFSSLTFYVHECPLPELTPAKKGGGFKKGRKRFWAKLDDVNRIRFETVVETPA